MIIMMIFNVNFIFSQNFISLFWGLFDDETDLRVRYWFDILRWHLHFMEMKVLIWIYLCSFGRRILREEIKIHHKEPNEHMRYQGEEGWRVTHLKDLGFRARIHHLVDVKGSCILDRSEFLWCSVFVDFGVVCYTTTPAPFPLIFFQCCFCAGDTHQHSQKALFNNPQLWGG